MGGDSFKKKKPGGNPPGLIEQNDGRS